MPVAYLSSHIMMSSQTPHMRLHARNTKIADPLDLQNGQCSRGSATHQGSEPAFDLTKAGPLRHMGYGAWAWCEQRSFLHSSQLSPLVSSGLISSTSKGRPKSTWLMKRAWWGTCHEEE